MKRKIAAASALLVLLSAVQGSALARPQEETFGVTAAAVAVDVVVRDGKGRMVRDLEREDFEIYEDGVRQTIQSFEVISRELEESRATGTAAEPGAPPPAAVDVQPTQPSILALVFDRLSPEARNLAKQAALAYVAQSQPGLDVIGVFNTGMALDTVQPYTSDREALQAAIEQAAGTAVARHQSNREAIRELSSNRAGLLEQAARITDPQQGAAAAGIEVEAKLLDMQLRMFRTVESLEADQQGYATMNGLLAVVNSLRAQPGRKTVVFFSEGLSLPPNVMPKFQAVIDAANRGNVTVYTLDAGGLRARSEREETRREMLAAANEQIRQRSSSTDDFRGALTQELERNEARLRQDPHSGLGDLARQTGGFLVRDTNDLAGAAERIGEEVRFHYMLSYTPSDPDYDGRFRAIDVKVKRSGVRVQARSGYYAVPSADPFPVQPYEAPALALLEEEPPPAAFPVRARGLSMPAPDRPGLVPILVEIPGGGLTVVVDEDEGTYRSDFTVVARVLDRMDRVVDRVSHHYTMTGPLSERDAAGSGDVLFYREVELEPGEYTVEAIAYDAAGEKAAVTESPVVVPGADGLQLASLVLVRGAEDAGDASASHPLRFGERILYPNLGEPIHKSQRDQLAVMLKACAPGGLASPEATLEVAQAGRSLGQLPLPLPAVGEDGRLEHVAGLPLGGFPPGDYELRITLRDGARQATRTASFSVAE